MVEFTYSSLSINISFVAFFLYTSLLLLSYLSKFTYFIKTKGGEYETKLIFIKKESILTLSTSYSTMCDLYLTLSLLIALSRSETGFFTRGPIKE